MHLCTFEFSLVCVYVLLGSVCVYVLLLLGVSVSACLCVLLKSLRVCCWDQCVCACIWG